MIEPGAGSVNTQLPRKKETSPWTVAFVVSIVTLFSFYLLGPFIGMGIAYMFYDGKPMDFIQDLATPMDDESMKMMYLFVQACATFFGLAVIPTLFWKSMTHKPMLSIFDGVRLKPIHFLMVAGIVFFYLGFNSMIMEWNANIDLPDGPFETWAKSMEQQLAELTKYLTSFTNVGQYLFGVFVIAILAGIGEEVVFRGLIQPQLYKATGNIHFAIWASAIFFSALHVQFYGFIPRVFLGALFGYMFYWSGNLWVPIFAHFTNNFLAVSSIYFGLSEVPGMETENPEQAPWYAVLVMSIICVALIYLFQKQFKKTDDVRA